MTRPVRPARLPTRADVTVSTTDDVTVVAASGDLDSSSAERFFEYTVAAMAHSPGGVVADLGAVTFCSCRGLSALMAADHAAHLAEVPFTVLAHQRAVLRPLRLLGLDRTLDVRVGASLVPLPRKGIS
ncbi:MULTISPECIES: STAS domain-containing protein [Amycolatopsis]|uniref:STAS domain-containing protein n=1 Tax=Amycolatopsis dendrobii TaxID=2760662 RepID=A0A7W3VSG1_9PSEU|nr:MULTISPECIES: STAS domain-containing protein [Amycolatopsis]MBB1151847.1 STAS domain-containing protein [Amycolatopsis dendrobii]UKD57945.1 STAS domain-containing protein [Amycolatopsis sp. FU40]